MSNADLRARIAAFDVALIDLLQAWLNTYAEHEPERGNRLLEIQNKGGFFTLTANFAPSTNTKGCVLTVTDFAGKTWRIGETV